MNAYTDIVDFVLLGKTPEQILAFKPSDEAQIRVNELTIALKNDTITPDERAELNHHREIDTIIRLAKAKARKHVQNR